MHKLGGKLGLHVAEVSLAIVTRSERVTRVGQSSVWWPLHVTVMVVDTSFGIVCPLLMCVWNTHFIVDVKRIPSFISCLTHMSKQVDRLTSLGFHVLINIFILKE